MESEGERQALPWTAQRALSVHDQEGGELMQKALKEYQARIEACDLGEMYAKGRADRERMRFVAKLLVTLGIACIPAVLVALS